MNDKKTFLVSFTEDEINAIIHCLDTGIVADIDENVYKISERIDLLRGYMKLVEEHERVIAQ